MPFVACGLNHTAPIALREKLVFSREDLPVSLLSLREVAGVNEAVILSTCNRTELYCEGESDPQSLVRWLAQHHHIPAANLNPYLYVHHEQQTVQHVMRVASGLDSMILGETQIFGQLKEAVAIAEKTGTIKSHLRKLFQYVFTVGKKIRTDTEIGANPLSLGYVIIHLAKRIFSDLTQRRVLLIGAGETIQHVSKYLYSNNIHNVGITNRTLEHAQAIVNRINAENISFANIEAAIMQADIIISAINTHLPIIGKGLIERLIKLRKHRPMVMIDLGVPRNIEPEIQQLSDVYLYSLDDLNSFLAENRNKRMQAQQIAESIVSSQTHHFMAEQRTQLVNHTIREYRARMQKFCDEVLNKSIQELVLGDDPVTVIQKLTHQLSNKFMHDPCVSLRTAAYQGDLRFIENAKKLLVPEK